MIESVKDDIEARLSSIEAGIFSLDDVRLLFIDLRDSLPASDKSSAKIAPLNDIFDLVAHPNKRNQGRTFKASKAIIDQFVTSIQKGGSVQVQLLDFAITEALQAALDALGIAHDSARLQSQEDKLRLNVYRLLDGVEMDVKEDAIEWARVDYDTEQGAGFIAFKLKPFENKIGNMTVSGSPTMRFRLV